MPGESRSLPDRPSLRHLKLEAKRRLAAGEFATLHDAQVAPAALIKTIGNMAADLRGDPVVLGQTPVQAYIQLQGMHYIAVSEPDPPHRLTGQRGLPVGSRVRDPRVAEPPVRTQGEVPAEVATIAEQAFAELGLTALLLAGGDTGGDASGDIA